MNPFPHDKDYDPEFPFEPSRDKQKLARIELHDVLKQCEITTKDLDEPPTHLSTNPR